VTNWRTVTLADVCNFENGDRGKNYPGKSAILSAGVPFVNAGDLDGGSLRGGTLSYISPDHFRKLSNGKFKKGDILFCLRGTLGKFARVESDISGAIASSLIIIRPKSSIHPDYLKSYLGSNVCKEQIELYRNGAAQPNLAASSLKRFEVPLPTIPEQQRIAAILDKADALRRKRKRSLELFDSLRQAIFLDMFDGSAQASSVSELLKDGLLLLHKDGNHGSNYPRADEFGDDGIPFLSARSIDDEGTVNVSQIQYLRTSKAESLKIGWIKAGDILLAHNASVGKVALYQGEYERALIGTSLTCYRPNPDRLSPQYLMSALRSQYFQSQLTKSMGQTTRNQVPITAQRDLKIPVPAIEQQREYGNVVASQARQAVLLNKHEAGLESLFASLQSRAFSGHL
jgi:type I restriction enzyme, S subunit